MRVLLVEDDGDQTSEITEYLNAEFPGAAVSVLANEYDFVQKIPEILRRPPDIVLLDVMLLRTPMIQGQDIDFPLDVTFSQDAGFRCAKKLRDVGSDVPIILYSVLDERDVSIDLAELPRDVFYVRKEFELNSLGEKMREIMPPSSGATRRV